MKEKILLLFLTALACIMLFLFFGIAIIIGVVLFVLQLFLRSELGCKICEYLKSLLGDTFNNMNSSNESESYNTENGWRRFEYYYFNDVSDSSSDIQKAYETLNVSPDCTDSELKKAYRECVKKYHPDVYEHKDLSNSQKNSYVEKFQEIESAYELLKQARGIA